MSDEIQSGGPDLAAIADRLYASPAPATVAPATTAPTATVQPDSAMRERGLAALETRIAEQARAAAEKARPTDDASIAKRMWAEPEPTALDDAPEAIKALRDTPERRMFSAQGTFASIAVEGEGVELAVVQSANAELREIFADVGASPGDAAEILSLANQMRATPATPEARLQMRDAAIDAVNRQYGQDAASVVADARALVARDPRIGKVLDSTGAGDHPNIVLKLISLARSAKLRGQL
jgi:hypothetical protein